MKLQGNQRVTHKIDSYVADMYKKFKFLKQDIKNSTGEKDDKIKKKKEVDLKIYE